MFVMTNDSFHGVDVGDPELSLGYPGTGHGKDIVAAHLRSRRTLVANLEGTRVQDIVPRLHSPGAVWRKHADVFRPRANEARLALLKRVDGVKIGVHDDPEQKLFEVEDIARDPNAFENREAKFE